MFSNHKLSNSLRYRGAKQLFHHQNTRQNHRIDVFRLGLSFIFLLAGIYINVNVPLSKSIINKNVIFQAILDDDVINRNITTKGNSYGNMNQSFSKFGLHDGLDIVTFNGEERRKSLIQLGNKCLPDDLIQSSLDKRLYISRFLSADDNSVLKQYDKIGELAQMLLKKGNLKSYEHLLAIQMDLWKFCVIGSGFASTFIDHDGFHFLDSIQSIFDLHETRKNYVVVAAESEENFDSHTPFMTSTILSLRSKRGIDVARSIVATIMLTSTSNRVDEPSNSQWLSKAFYHHVDKAVKKHSDEFLLLRYNCNGLQVNPNYYGGSDTKEFSLHTGSCTISGQTPCCQITKEKNNVKEVVMFMTHPKIYSPFLDPIIDDELRHQSTIGIIDLQHEGIMTKNSRAFDIFLQNNCLPSWQCQVCIVRKRPDDQRSPCEACKTECKCYCENICRIRPQNNHVTKKMVIFPPRNRKDYDRLIPRMVHQTYFEAITKEKHPNFSRLVASWQNSGWEYKFYDDEASVAFLNQHFAPEVREAYDSILPGKMLISEFAYGK